MSGAVCPSCGVSVLPGYVRCPKCRKPLPRRLGHQIEGGTAVDQTRRWPVAAALAIAAIGTVVIIYVGVLATSRDSPRAAPRDAASTPSEPARAAAPAPAPEPEAPAAPRRPDPVTVAADLERALKQQRLWATVTVVGDRVDVRSGSCSDPAMAPMLADHAASLRAAGLTQLRCLEQSGLVVTDRDL